MPSLPQHRAVSSLAVAVSAALLATSCGGSLSSPPPIDKSAMCAAIVPAWRNYERMVSYQTGLFGPSPWEASQIVFAVGGGWHQAARYVPVKMRGSFEFEATFFNRLGSDYKTDNLRAAQNDRRRMQRVSGTLKENLKYMEHFCGGAKSVLKPS